MKNLAFIALMGIVCLFVSCSDDDTPSDANENFITSFALTLGSGEKYDAAIDGNVITMTVPYNVVLDGAKAEVAYTQSAKIMPDPATVTDWNAEQVFVVTSYNGEKNEYTYNIVRSEITHSGDVVLATMDDMDNFLASATSVIDGNLTIGSDDDNTGDITSFAGLANLKSVKGSVILKNSIKTSDFTGFDNLQSAGGIVMGSSENESLADVEMLSFRNLKNVDGNISIYGGDKLSYVEFASLQDVTGSVYVDSKVIREITMSKVEKIVGKLTIGKNDYNDTSNSREIKIVEFSSLLEIGDTLKIDYLPMLQEISFPVLTESGAIEFPCIPFSCNRLSIPEIKVVNGGVYFRSTTQGSGIFSTYNTEIKEIDAFEKTEEIKGAYYMSGLLGLLKMPSFNNLKRIGGLLLGNTNKSAIGELDFSNIEFTEYNGIFPEVLLPYSCDVFKTKEDLSNTNVTINSDNTEINFKKVHNLTLVSTKEFPVVESVLGNLSIENTSSMSSCTMPDLKNVEGYMYVKMGAMAKSVLFPTLEKVGGQLIFDGLFNNPTFKSDFSSLATVCCNDNPSYYLTGTYKSYEDDVPYGSMRVMSTRSFSFPALTHIGGSGLTLERLSSFNCPNLKQIDGILCANNSTSLSTLKLSALEKLSGLKFMRVSKFSDYSVFSKFITDGQITKEHWSVTDCAYNPTYEDMKAGRYKPAE